AIGERGLPIQSGQQIRVLIRPDRSCRVTHERNPSGHGTGNVPEITRISRDDYPHGRPHSFGGALGRHVAVIANKTVYAEPSKYWREIKESVRQMEGHDAARTQA